MEETKHDTLVVQQHTAFKVDEITSGIGFMRSYRSSVAIVLFELKRVWLETRAMALRFRQSHVITIVLGFKHCELFFPYLLPMWLEKIKNTQDNIIQDVEIKRDQSNFQFSYCHSASNEAANGCFPLGKLHLTLSGSKWAFPLTYMADAQ